MINRPRQQQRALRKAKFKVSRWNDRVHVGDRVHVLRDGGSVDVTTTESHAWVLDSGTPVIMLAGISGCYDLSRVAAIEKEQL